MEKNNLNWGIAAKAETQTNNNTGNNNTPSIADALELYFSTDVNIDSATELITKLKEKERISLGISAQYGTPNIPIKLHIHSFGGLITAGFAISDIIRTLRVPVHTYILGSAASAATLISCIGTKRFIYKNSRILVHQLSGVAWVKWLKLRMI